MESTPKFEIKIYYESILSKEKFSAISTLKTLMEFLKNDTSTTAIGLNRNIRSAIEQLKTLDFRTEVDSVAEIYLRYITINASKFDDFESLKEELVRRSELYIEKVNSSRNELAKNAHKFITDGCTILVHSLSRAVFETLKEAFVKHKKSFTVYITESAPDYNGKIMLENLLGQVSGINATLILDSAIGYIMERIDLVMVGAEGIAESGGIINKIGTYPMAICAKAHNKPFYVLAESFKFIRHYPLTQADIPDRVKWRTDEVSPESHPLVDYTPPQYITLLLTDLGTLTTAAVCDNLVQLYT